MNDFNLSPHIKYSDVIRSTTAAKYKINNTPNEEQLAAAKLLANHIIEPIIERSGYSITISSFFRSKELNEKIKGAINSQHMKGQAVDIKPKDMSKLNELFVWIKVNLDFDQLIRESTWIHISFRGDGNRKQVIYFQ